MNDGRTVTEIQQTNLGYVTSDKLWNISLHCELFTIFEIHRDGDNALFMNTAH